MCHGDLMSSPAHTALRRIVYITGVSLTLAASGALLGCADDVVLGNDEAFMPDRTPDDDPANKPLEPNDCDLSGTWMAQLHGKSKAIGLIAESNNWFYYELDDQGDDVVVERSIDCGFVVCKATSLELSDKQTRELALRNRQDGLLNTDPNDLSKPATPEDKVDPRKITFKKSEEGVCEFSMERWWSVRSAPTSYLPARADYSTSTIGSVSTANPLPPKETPPAFESGDDWDIDDDGAFGIRLMLDKPGTGWRDAIQRDWNEVPTTHVADGVQDFTVVAQFDNEETVYGASNPLLDQKSQAQSKGNSIRFVKVKDKAPADLDGILAYCNEQVVELFQTQEPRDYCSLRPPEINTRLESDDDDDENGGENGGDDDD